MATYTTQAAIGEREDLANVIYRIDPSECPAFSAIKKTTASSIFTEWQVQNLDTASAVNYHDEGATTATGTAVPTVRVGNYCQISKKVFATSGTLDAVDLAGREREHNYQKILKSLELRRDIEKSITDTNQARDGSDPRKSASLMTWISNGSVGATGAFAVGANGTATVTAGTARALTLDMVQDAMQAAWEDGGNPKMLLASATNRANLSDLSATGNLVSNDVNMTAAKAPTYVSSVSVMLTDFGTIDIVPSRYMSNDKIFLIDPDFVELATLNGRNFQEEALAKNGDAETSHILVEWALKPTAPAAHAGIFDLDGTI